MSSPRSLTARRYWRGKEPLNPNEQWKQADQGAVANHALWKKFDDACNAAYKVVESWHDKIRQDSTQAKAQRLALIEEITPLSLSL